METMFYYLFFICGAAYSYHIWSNDTCINFHVTSLNTCLVNSDGMKLSPMLGLSLQDCVAQCTVRENCAGLIYRRLNLFCQLYREINGQQEVKGDCVYVKRSDMLNGRQDKDMQICENENKGAYVTPECSYPEVDNGEPIGNIFYVDSKQTILCNSGYSNLGRKMITCLSNLTWTAMPECSIECSVPVFDHAYVDADMKQYPARATVTCHENYVSTRTDSKLYNITEESLICNKTGSWIPDITCTYFLNIFNMALYKPARQSSTYLGRVANLATDGLWYPDFNDGSCTHADLLEERSWWEVDLLETYSIRRVVILSRKFALFAVRFHDVTITVGMEPDPTEFCAFYQGHEVHDSPIHLYCERRILARYVRITKPNHRYFQDNLAICEVGVYED